MPDDIVRELRHLPSTPKVLPRLKLLLSDSNSSIYEIVALIRLDPGIAARVLQVSNSAYFSKGTRCHTVEEAVGRVGFNQIFELVSYAVASQVLARPLAVYALPNDELWRLSVACALAAEELAAYGGIERNVAYTVGLLHGVGMVAIDEWALRQQFPLQLEYRGYPADASESERTYFGFTQAEVGAALLRDWAFPPMISEPVRHQYAPGASAGFARTASLLAVAKWIRSAVCDEGPPPPPPAALLQTLRLSTLVLEKTRLSVRRRLDVICTLLEISPESPTPREMPDWVKFPSEYPEAPTKF
ncbi:MAG: HDOD domain-containing protein [Opitutae bacterium]|nr:HDOD domain-containing protein [Opitutae bacterium]